MAVGEFYRLAGDRLGGLGGSCSSEGGQAGKSRP
jgi:hypothetical protein